LDARKNVPWTHETPAFRRASLRKLLVLLVVVKIA
jgi:hypothetical protein